MYSNPLIPHGYSPYIWPHIPGIFLPYSPTQKLSEAITPERVTCVDQAFTPEEAKIGQLVGFSVFLKCIVFDELIDEDAPLNLSLKGRSRSHNIWSPGSLCEQEMKTNDVKPDSSVGNAVKSAKLVENKWRWDAQEKECQNKLPTIGPSGEKTFTVNFSFIYVRLCSQIWGFLIFNIYINVSLIVHSVSPMYLFPKFVDYPR